MIVPDDSEMTGLLRRRKRWLVVSVIAAVLAGWFGRFAYLRIALRPTPRPDYWAAQLATLDPPGPGALSVAEAKKLLMSYPRLLVPPPATQGRVGPDGNPVPPIPGIGSLPANPPSPGFMDLCVGLWDESRPEIQAAGQLFSSAAFKERREAMRRALEVGWWDDGIDLAGCEVLRYREEYKQWAHGLVAHSRWIREHEHDAAGMVEDWRMVLRLSRQLQRSNLDWACTMAVALSHTVGYETQYVACEGAWQGEVATFMREADAALRPESLLARLAEAERIYLRNAIEHWYVREGGDWIDVSEAAANRHINYKILWGGPGAAPSRLWNVASPLFHDYQTACANIDRLPEQLKSLVDIRACLRAQDGRATPPPMRAGVLDGLDDVFSIAHGIGLCYQSMTALDAGLTMLALAEFKRKQGRYPDKLDELVPGYLPRLPVDYGDRGVLRYRRSGGDYVLYSIGRNGVDDGGRAPKAGWERTLAEENDDVYSPTTRPAAR